jgi:hypothetical protein
MQVDIDENSGQGGFGEVEKFDELKLETGEVARLAILVSQAAAYYVHELKPVEIVGGVIQMEVKNRKDKSTYEVPKTGWKGRRICTGVTEIPNPADPEHPLPGPMQLKGIDPENCIVCAAAAELGILELRAILRYAIPVVRITTTSRSSTDIQDPPSAKICVLPLTALQYREFATTLKGIRELYGWGPEVKVTPSMADIVIYCEDAGFRRYAWRTPMRPHWRKDPATGDLRNPALQLAVLGLWRNPANRPTAEQLEAACGRRTDLAFLQADLAEVIDSYAEKKAIEAGERTGGRTAPAGTASPGTDASLAEGLDDLESILGDETPATATAGAAVDGGEADDLAGLEEFAPGEPAAGNGNGHGAAEPASSPADDIAEELGGAGEAEAAGADEGESFDDILGALDGLS